ncbi:RNA polymerase sigma factor [Jatrophihabitans sp.]|jgi:RNA polymerase sigma-70 factor (ECF subfamily)|uniref:RNA polymerase sigma factor n=1 Tax=Jatrophihabitans sp. TaxID=1932789 RepID=UPI002F05093D
MSQDGGADGFDDGYLVRRAQEGYLDAYAELVNRHSLLAYRVALRILGHQQDAEDVAQDALVTAWQQLPQFRGESSFSTWLYRIVTRRAVNRINRDRRHNSTDVLTEVADDSSRTEIAFERNETVDAVTRAIQALPPTQRVVVVLHHLEGLSYADVAAITASSVPAVRTQLYRARRALGSALADWR